MGSAVFFWPFHRGKLGVWRIEDDSFASQIHSSSEAKTTFRIYKKLQNLQNLQAAGGVVLDFTTEIRNFNEP